MGAFSLGRSRDDKVRPGGEETTARTSNALRRTAAFPAGKRRTGKGNGHRRRPQRAPDGVTDLHFSGGTHRPFLPAETVRGYRTEVYRTSLDISRKDWIRRAPNGRRGLAFSLQPAQLARFLPEGTSAYLP